MKKIKKLLLQEEIRKEAEKIEKEIAEDPSLDSIEFTEEMEQKLLEKIQAYERSKEKEQEEFSEELTPDFSVHTNEKVKEKLTDEEREALKLGMHLLEGRKRRRRFPKRKGLIVVAATLVLVLGIGMTSVGSKSYLKTVIDKIVGTDERASVINVEDMEIQSSEDADENKFYKEVRKKLGMQVLRIRFRPSGMRPENYVIDENQKRAQIFYEYQGETIIYSIYLNDDDSSFAQKESDVLVDKLSIYNNSVKMDIEGYISEDTGKRYVAKFEFYGVQYQLRGNLDLEVMKKILKDIKIY